MTNQNIIEAAFNYTKELIAKNKTKIITSSGRQLEITYTIEEEDEFIVHSIRTEHSILEQEVWIYTDEEGTKKYDGSFNAGMVHSHIIGLIRNY